MAKLIRDRSTKEKDEWWRSIQEAAKKTPKLTYERSAAMANSEDVLEAARNHTRDFTKFDRAFQEYHLAEAHLILALAAEVRELQKDREMLAEWLRQCASTRDEMADVLRKNRAAMAQENTDDRR